jgi:two-component system NtrC family sensor kinase
LLNLVNNAFWATQQRFRPYSRAAGAGDKEADYTPKVTVITRWLSEAAGVPVEARSEVEIRVTDNGTGIPAAILPKIFQPFFTTKPSGEGTGLGLSLSCDIVTKGHGGTIEVESVEGEGTTFVVRLPIENA